MRFEKAIAIYGLKLEMLEKQAHSHADRELVNRYQQFAIKGQSVQRDRLAHRPTASLVKILLSSYPCFKYRLVFITSIRR